MLLIKVRFLKNGLPTGRPYTYKSNVAVKPGDTVEINKKTQAVVIDNDVLEEEVIAFKDQLKEILGKVE